MATILKIMLTLILVTPVLGSLGIFPAPTRDLYNTDLAFSFIRMTMSTYLVYGVAFSCGLGALLMWTKRMPLAMLIILPITVNVIGFHAFLDGGLLTGGAIMGNIMLVLNLYFMYTHRKEYKSLLTVK